MYGQGNYSNQFSQNQAPIRPPYQQQIPASIPPGTSTAPPSAVNPSPQFPAQGGYSFPPLYNLPLAPHAQTLQSPVIAMSRTVTSGQPHGSATILPGTPPIPLSMSMPSRQFNAQRNPYPPLPAGSHNALHVLTSLPPPPLAWPPTNSSQTVLPLRSEKSSFWPMVNQQPNNPQGFLPIPSLDPSAANSSQSAVISVHGGTSRPTAAPPPHLPSYLPPPPPLPPQPSSVSTFSSTKVQQQFETEQKSERSLNSATRSSESSDVMLNPSKRRIDAPISGGGHIEEDQMNCKLGNQVKNASLLDSPPKPSDEKLVQNIELLCQYIAKNGPGFEDMIRGRQEGNPDFLFLFGGVPGSEDAIAHNYFQWRKKYSSIERFPEGQRQPDLSHSETSSPVKPENLVLGSLSDGQLDSDMEMEDDITHLNEDESISKPAANLSCGSDSILVKSDVQEELQGLQDGLGCVPATDVTTQAFPRTVVSLNQEKGSNSLYPEDHKKTMNRVKEVQSDIDSPGYAELPLGGIVLNFPADQENNVCSSLIKNYDLDNKLYHITKSGSPFRLLKDYASNDSPETNQKAGPRESLTVNSAGPESAMLSKIEMATEPLGESSNQLTVLINSTDHRDVKKQAFTASSILGVADEDNDENNDKPESVPTISSSENFQREGSSRSQSDNIHKDAKFVKEVDGKEFDSCPVTVKVDEFGRLLKEAGSDSDSDSNDSWCAERYNKRARYRSPSPAPRSRRSIHRSKREKRSRSPSWSPQRRRSRSRSPCRRGKEFGGFSTRRGRFQIAKCFDFSRGRCRRGASCRYLHQDSEFEGSRYRRRNMQSSEIPASPARSSPVEEMKSVPERAGDVAQGQSTQLPLKLPSESLNVASEKVGADPMRYFSPDAVCGEEVANSPTVVFDVGLLTKRDEAHQISVSYPQKMQNETTGHLLAKSPLVDSFQVNTGAAVALGANHLPQQTNLSTLPKSLDRESTPTQGEFPVSTPLPVGSDAVQLPRPPLLPLPLIRDSGSQVSFQRPGNDFVTSVASSSSQPASSGSVPTYMLPNHQLPYFAPSLQADWNSMSTCQSLPHVQYGSDSKGETASGSAATGGYVQNGKRTDLGPQALFKPYPTEAPPFYASQHQSFYASQSQHQAYAAPEKAYNHPDFHAGNPYLTSESAQQFHTGSGHPRELPKSSQPYPYYPSIGFQYTGDSISRDLSSNLGTSAYRLDLMHEGQVSYPPDYGESRFRTQCNPCSSSLEQSHIAQFGSGSENVHEVVGTEVLADRQAVAGVGTMRTNSSVESIRLPLPGGGQYDPLFDSSESKPIKRVNDWEPVHDAAGIIDSNKSLDIKDNKMKDIGTFIPSLSQEDDGFGETADAEVGVVENASPSQSFAIAETNDFADEVETSQVKSPSKRKKHKEPKSGHLFKNAIANFVKEVLRPSWRQGNMSKEAFKTIVKKTVDKVAGAMKSHRIPKSQVKIDQYIDSSQRKLTKLVMGYVDKYVKA